MITGHHQLQTRLAPTPSYIFAAPRTYTCGSALLTTGGRNNGSLWSTHMRGKVCRYCTAASNPGLNSDTSSDLPPLRLQFELTDPQPEIRTRAAESPSTWGTVRWMDPQWHELPGPSPHRQISFTPVIPAVFN